MPTDFAAMAATHEHDDDNHHSATTTTSESACLRVGLKAAANVPKPNHLVSEHPRSHHHPHTHHHVTPSRTPPSSPLCLVYALVFVFVCLPVSHVSAQYRPQWPSPLVQQEIFLLNLEDGYFGCQVNDSQDVLQLFELSKLCDGIPQCFRGSDELTDRLKCTDRSECPTFAHYKLPIITKSA